MLLRQKDNVPLHWQEASAYRLSLGTKLDNLATIALRRPAFWGWSNGPHDFSFLCQLHSRFAACVRLSIERLSNRSWTAHLTQDENLNLKFPGFRANL